MTQSRWQYEPAPDLGHSLARRLSRFPRQPDMLMYGARLAAAVGMRLWLRGYHRLRVGGRENLPADGGSFILAANHASHLDALCLLAALPLKRLHRSYPAAARDYFFVGLPRLAFSAIFINALPFGRQVRVRESLETCRRLLAEPGNALIVFPEGTRSTTGQLGEFRSGVGMLAAGVDVPVLPCAVFGGFAAWPKGATLPRPRGVRVVIGQPRRYGHLPPGRASADEVARDLHGAVAQLMGG